MVFFLTLFFHDAGARRQATGTLFRNHIVLLLPADEQSDELQPTSVPSPDRRLELPVPPPMVFTSQEIATAVQILFESADPDARAKADAFLQDVQHAKCNEVVGPCVGLLQDVNYRSTKGLALFAAQTLHASFRACVVKAKSTQRSHINVEDDAWRSMLGTLYDLLEHETVARKQVARALAACLLKSPAQNSQEIVNDVVQRFSHRPAARVDVLAALPEETAESSMRPDRRTEHLTSLRASKGLALNAIATAVGQVGAEVAFQAATPWLGLGKGGTGAFVTEAVGAVASYPQHQNVALLEAAHSALEAALSVVEHETLDIIVTAELLSRERYLAFAADNRGSELLADLGSLVATNAVKVEHGGQAVFAALRGLVGAHAALVNAGHRQSNTFAPALADAWRGMALIVENKKRNDIDMANAIVALAGEFAGASTRETFISEEKDERELALELAGDAVKHAYKTEAKCRFKKDNTDIALAIAKALASSSDPRVVATACERMRALAKITNPADAAALISGVAAATRRHDVPVEPVCLAIAAAAGILPRLRPDQRDPTVVGAFADYAVRLAEGGGYEYQSRRAGAVSLMHVCTEVKALGIVEMLEACRPSIVRAHRFYFGELAEKSTADEPLRRGQEPVATLIVRAVAAILTGTDGYNLIDALADRFGRRPAIDTATDLCVALSAVRDILGYGRLPALADLASRALTQLQSPNDIDLDLDDDDGSESSSAEGDDDDDDPQKKRRMVLGMGVNIYYAMFTPWRDGTSLRDIDSALAAAASKWGPYQGTPTLGAVAKVAVHAAGAALFQDVPGALAILELVAVVDPSHAGALAEAAGILVDQVGAPAIFSRDPRAAASALAFLRRVPPEYGLRFLAAIVQARITVPAKAASKAIDLARHFLSSSSSSSLSLRDGYLSFLFAATSLALLPSSCVADAAGACLAAKDAFPSTFSTDLRRALEPIADILAGGSKAFQKTLDDLLSTTTDPSKTSADASRAFKKKFKAVTGGKRKAPPSSQSNNNNNDDETMARSSRPRAARPQQQRGAPRRSRGRRKKQQDPTTTIES